MLKQNGTRIGVSYRGPTDTVRFLLHLWYSFLSDSQGKTSHDHYLQEEFTVNLYCTLEEKNEFSPHSYHPHSSLRHSFSKYCYPVKWALFQVSLWQDSSIKVKAGLLTTQNTCLLFNFSQEWKLYSAFTPSAPHSVLREDYWNVNLRRLFQAEACSHV